MTYEFKVDDSYYSYLIPIHTEIDNVFKNNSVISVSLDKGLLKVVLKKELNKNEQSTLQDIITSKGAKRQINLTKASLAISNDIAIINSQTYGDLNSMSITLEDDGNYLLDFSAVFSVNGNGRPCCFTFALNGTAIGRENIICPKAFNETTAILKHIESGKKGDIFSVMVRNRENSSITVKYRTFTALRIE